jgi:hypothetical protein
MRYNFLCLYMTARGKITSIVMVRNNEMLGDIYEQISSFYSSLITQGSNDPSHAAQGLQGFKIRDLKNWEMLS